MSKVRATLDGAGRHGRALFVAAAIVAVVASQAFSAEGRYPKRAPEAPTAMYTLEIQYLALTTTPGTTAPASMMEYEVRLWTEAGFATEAAAHERALQIGQQGAIVGPPTSQLAIPAHRVQAVNIYRLMTADR